MKQQLDLGYLNDIFRKHYKSKSEMARSIGISRSHLQQVFNNKGIGVKVLNGLQREAINKGFEYELCLMPEPIIINGTPIQSIEVIDNDDNLIASITSKNIISDRSTKVIVVPFDI